jgi:hypothetical protein
MENSIMTENKKEKELTLALTQFFKLIYVDFGINKINDKLRNWYELSWEEFKKELESHSVKFNDCLISDWKDFFQRHKNKVVSLMK